MYFKNIDEEDFERVFSFIEQLWTYRTYNKREIFEVYQRVLNNPYAFAFLVMEGEEAKGFCHGDFIDTFWMEGETVYISSLITDSNVRGQGYGRALLDHIREIALERGCKAMILDSGFPREKAHKFYESYGFEKSCYGFELVL